MAHKRRECDVRMSSYLNDLILNMKIFLYVFFADLCVIKCTDCVRYFLTPLLHFSIDLRAKSEWYKTIKNKASVIKKKSQNLNGVMFILLVIINANKVL